MRKTSLLCFMLSSVSFCLSQNIPDNRKCIPYLINNKGGENRIYIQDPHVEDTLKIVFRTMVHFEHPLSETEKPIVVKAVEIKRLEIISKVVQQRTDLLACTPFTSPLERYIKDLCSAKLTYWYIYQPYKELPGAEIINGREQIVMGGILYLVPETCKLKRTIQ